MVVVASIFGVLGRFAGKLLTAALGWASTLLFGRVPQDRQILLAGITFGAVIWAVLVFAVLWPDGGSVLLTFAPIPEWIDEGLVRLGMLAGAVAIPPAMALVSLRLLQPNDRPKGPRALAVHILRGYPMAAALATMLVFLAAIAIVRKASSLVRRRTDAHVPIVVKPGGYESLVADLDTAISDAGIDVRPMDAPVVLVLPGRLLAAAAGSHVRGLLPERLVRLVGRDVEVLIYPSDVAMSGRKVQLARVQAAIASRLTTAKAWLTNSAEGQAIEDRLMKLAQPDAPRSEQEATLAWVDRHLATDELPYEEWEVLYRERLQVERDLLLGLKPGEDMPAASGEAAPRRWRDALWSLRPRDLPGTLMSAAILGLLAADVALLLLNRDATREESSLEQRSRWFLPRWFGWGR
ncbi:MAG TPA: hypothetical protein VFP83_00245 [Candidatus Limnocylindria bacterium]|nr:hypothetical protein [Candidatus Limnocylindria bacterium]